MTEIHTMSDANVLRLAELLTSADLAHKPVRVAWDDGLKVKVGEGMWTPILSRPEAEAEPEPAPKSEYDLAKAECRQCGYTTTDGRTIDAWNDYGTTCPNCEFDTGDSVWTNEDGSAFVCHIVNGEMVGEPEPITT